MTSGEPCDCAGRGSAGKRDELKALLSGLVRPPRAEAGGQRAATPEHGAGIAPDQVR
jgi:hypothetical protein